MNTQNEAMLFAVILHSIYVVHRTARGLFFYGSATAAESYHLYISISLTSPPNPCLRLPQWIHHLLHYPRHDTRNLMLP